MRLPTLGLGAVHGGTTSDSLGSGCKQKQAESTTISVRGGTEIAAAKQLDELAQTTHGP